MLSAVARASFKTPVTFLAVSAPIIALRLRERRGERDHLRGFLDLPRAWGGGDRDAERGLSVTFGVCCILEQGATKLSLLHSAWNRDLYACSLEDDWS
jgi:hypothetical protein